MAAVNIDRFAAEDPVGKPWPVFHNGKYTVFCEPVGKHFAHARVLLASAPADYDFVEILVWPVPCTGRAGNDTFSASNTAAGILVHLMAVIKRENARCRFFASSNARTAPDAAVYVVNRLCAADDAEVLEMGLGTVVRAPRNRNLDMIGVRINNFFKFSGKVLSIHICLNAVDPANTGHNIAGCYVGIAVIRFHVDAAKVTLNRF